MLRLLRVAGVSLVVGAAAGCRAYWPEGVRADRAASVERLLAGPPAGGIGGMGAAPAQPAGAALEDFVAFALERNPGLRAAAAHWQAAMHRVDTATALPDPQFQYTGFLEPIETRTGPQRNRLALMQKLPWPGKLTARGAVAASGADAQWWRLEGRRRTVQRDVSRHWYETAYVARATQIARDHLQILQRLESVVQRRIQAGGRQDDLIRLQVEIGRATDTVARLEANRPALMAQLAAVCDYRGEAPLPAPVLDAPAAAVPPLASLLAALLDGNPDLAEMRERIRGAEHRHHLAQLAPIPDLTVGAMWMDTGPARIPNQRDSGDDPVAVTLGINLPVWAGKYGGAIRAAQSERLAAESAMRERENGLRAAVHLQRFRLEDAARQIALYRDTLLPRAEQALTLAESAYRSADGDLLSVIDSERMLLNFRRSYWRAVADYGRARIEIEALVGTEVR